MSINDPLGAYPPDTYDPAWDDIAGYYARDVGVYEAQRSLMDSYLAPGWSVIDVGCGPGHHLRYLSRDGRRVVGIDRSRTMLSIAAESVAGTSLDVSLYRQDATRLDFPDGSFEAAISLNNTIGVIPGEENRLRAVREMVRVSRRRCIIELLHGQRGTLKTVRYFKDSAGRRVAYQSRRYTEEEILEAVRGYPSTTVRVRDSVLGNYFFALIVEKQ